MSLEITHEILDQIIFGMEDQEQEYVFDLLTGDVLPGAAVADRNGGAEEDTVRYVELPDWSSSMGFHLMERFVASLRNPIFREELRASLAAGRGVFRRFKNTLQKSADIERLWYQFKEREMRRFVADWFESTVEALGLEKLQLDLDDAETLELVLSDFVIDRDGTVDEGLLRELDRSAFREAYQDLPAALADDMWRKERKAYELRPEEVLSARTPEGDLAGFLWAVTYGVEAEDESVLTVCRVLQVYVEREFRGLGLSRALVERLLADAFHDGVDTVLTAAGGAAVGLGDGLERMGWRMLSRSYILDVGRWGRASLYT